jgi:hypothetical protein
MKAMKPNRTRHQTAKNTARNLEFFEIQPVREAASGLQDGS